MVLLELLGEIKDPRRAQGQRYKLAPLLLSIVLSVLSGTTSFRKMALYIAVQRDRLNQLWGTQWQDTPSYGAIRDFLAALDESSLETVLRRHAHYLSEASETAAVEAGLRCIALDGKALRGSAQRLDEVRARQIVSAFAHADRLVLAQCEIEDKTNEIPVVQQLIAELGLSDCLYTADALHCQKKRWKSPWRIIAIYWFKSKTINPVSWKRVGSSRHTVSRKT